MNVNKVIIVGRLTRAPESRTTPTGQTVCTFGVATSRVWKDPTGEKKEKTEFHNIITWGRLAEICQNYLVKGQMVFIEGRIETRNWTAPDGTKRTRTEIVAENLQLGPKPRGVTMEEVVEEEVPPEEPLTTEEEEINVEEVPF
ncbi:MAG: single-stranded DNA-binding protein [Patescibacteria group bacterium]|nr:single-stranded DNA-binding protein [Patescibacteria group bacterium]